MLRDENTHHNSTVNTVTTETSNGDVTAQTGNALTSHEMSSDDVPLVKSEGFMPLQFETQTSSSSSPAPIKDTQKNGPPSESDISEGENKLVSQNSASYTKNEGIKSSLQVGELFDDSLQHALKINSISAGLKRKYLLPHENIVSNAKDTNMVSPLGYVQNDSGNNASEFLEMSEAERLSSGTDPVVRLSRSEDEMASQRAMLKSVESEPCLAKANDNSQNCNVNSLTTKVSSCEVSVNSSNHSFYATPSTSDHRPLNETYQINVVAPQQQSQSRASMSTSSVRSGSKGCQEDVLMDHKVSANGIPVVVQVR